MAAINIISVLHAPAKSDVAADVSVTSRTFNPLKPSVIMWLHFECSAPYRPNVTSLISDIRALWHSGLSARVPECQKLKTLCSARMARYNNLRSWALKG